MLMVRLHYVLRFILIYYLLLDVIVYVLFVYWCWFVFVVIVLFSGWCIGKCFVHVGVFGKFCIILSFFVGGYV